MLSPIEMGAMATAGLGGFTMMWGNIKGIFARLESIVIVRADLNGSMRDDVMDYCWAHFKSSPLGIRKFYADNYFIRPKNRLGRVACEMTGKYITFWNGYRPIFVTVCMDSNATNSGDTTISFIRGTFDLEKLLIDSVEYHDKFKHEKTNKSFRYYVKRCFGSKGGGDEGHTPQKASYKGGYADELDHNNQGFKPLFYSKEDIGTPTSESPMNNLAYANNVMEFYEEVSRWKESKEWFISKGLPWRFGAGLFGPPGSGKSSLAKAIGQSLDMPIHSYDLTTMDNEELVNHWQKSLAESPCMVLLEDIDRIFDENRQIKTDRNKSPLTLDCLLNCISGVQPSDGILILVTANDVTKLDPALGVPDGDGRSTRPGRLDRAVYVGILDKQGRQKIAKRILSDNLNLIDGVVIDGEGETGAQFENRCSRLALERYWNKNV